MVVALSDPVNGDCFSWISLPCSTLALLRKRSNAAAWSPLLSLDSGGGIVTLRHDSNVLVDKSAARHVGSLFPCVSPWCPDGMVPKAKTRHLPWYAAMF